MNNHWIPRMCFVAGSAIALCLAATGAGAESIRRGDIAPPIVGQGVIVKVAPASEDTSRPLTLIFMKLDDTHSRQAVAAVTAVHDRHPRTCLESRTVAVLSRLQREPDLAELAIPAGWGVLSDTSDTLYQAFHIIATPTVVVVGRDGRVVGFHPGYSTALADAVRLDLVRAIDGDAVANASSPTPGIMKIQMGRRMAERRLWDRALAYYNQAAVEMPLPPDIQFEMAKIHLELRQPAEAIKVLDALGNSAPDMDAAAELRKRAEAMASKPTATLEPPNVP